VGQTTKPDIQDYKLTVLELVFVGLVYFVVKIWNHEKHEIHEKKAVLKIKHKHLRFAGALVRIGAGLGATDFEFRRSAAGWWPDPPGATPVGGGQAVGEAGHTATARQDAMAESSGSRAAVRGQPGASACLGDAPFVAGVSDRICRGPSVAKRPPVAQSCGRRSAVSNQPTP
jgi:hypothetical protein